MGGLDMSQETLTTAAAVGTFVVITATAIAAVVQLRHLRAQNQLTGLLTVFARVEDPESNKWVDAARDLLTSRMPDPEFRRSLVDGTYERKNNPWLNLANSYDWVGSLVKHDLIPEESLLDVYSGRITQAWAIIEGVVPLVRKRFGPSVWENFEFLVVRAGEWNRRYPNGTYPKGVPRLEVNVTWPELAAPETNVRPDAQ
jgi:hypothetical protein